MFSSKQILGEFILQYKKYRDRRTTARDNRVAEAAATAFAEVKSMILSV
jgi:hypothetical protein